MQQGKQTKRLPGFYIALCCCVVVIGIAGFFAQNYNSTQTTTAVNTVSSTSKPSNISAVYPEDEVCFEDSEAVSSSNTIVIDEETPAPTETATETTTTTTELAEYEVDNPDFMPAASIVESDEAVVLSDPVPNMTVLYGFSGDTLMYNDVLGDWRTHNGVDIEADLGSSVAAAAAGTVSEVSCGSYGNKVVIEHEGGIKTVYEQLKDICVNEGDTVTQAEVIGIIADSVGETTKQAHLHYEVYKDGVAVDPLSL